MKKSTRYLYLALFVVGAIVLLAASQTEGFADVMTAATAAVKKAVGAKCEANADCSSNTCKDVAGGKFCA